MTVPDNVPRYNADGSLAVLTIDQTDTGEETGETGRGEWRVMHESAR